MGWWLGHLRNLASIRELGNGLSRMSQRSMTSMVSRLLGMAKTTGALALSPLGLGDGAMAKKLRHTVVRQCKSSNGVVVIKRMIQTPLGSLGQTVTKLSFTTRTKTGLAMKTMNGSTVRVASSSLGIYGGTWGGSKFAQSESWHDRRAGSREAASFCNLLAYDLAMFWQEQPVSKARMTYTCAVV